MIILGNVIFRVVLLTTLISCSFSNRQTPELQFFNLSTTEIDSEGSITYYSNSQINIDSNEFLAIEGWQYDISTKEYIYFCYVKIANEIIKLEKVAKPNSDNSNSSVYRKDDITLTIETHRIKPSTGESYFVKGKLIIGNKSKTKAQEIIGHVVV